MLQCPLVWKVDERFHTAPPPVYGLSFQAQPLMRLGDVREVEGFLDAAFHSRSSQNFFSMEAGGTSYWLPSMLRKENSEAGFVILT